MIFILKHAEGENTIFIIFQEGYDDIGAVGPTFSLRVQPAEALKRIAFQARALVI